MSMLARHVRAHRPAALALLLGAALPPVQRAANDVQSASSLVRFDVSSGDGSMTIDALNHGDIGVFQRK